MIGTAADHRGLLPPQIRADGSAFFAAAKPEPSPRTMNRWSRQLYPAAVGMPPNFIGLEDPHAVAKLVTEARAAAWARPGDGR